jgi:hypothetical protein
MVGCCLCPEASGGRGLVSRPRLGESRSCLPSPVHVPSMTSAATYVDVGDHVAWTLSLIDTFLPEHLKKRFPADLVRGQASGGFRLGLRQGPGWGGSGG